jgi:hypothetical protein
VAFTSLSVRVGRSARDVSEYAASRKQPDRMASLRQHMDDCQRLLGQPHEEVHRWIDEFYSSAGAKHRRFRHHWDGVKEAEQLFGEEGAKAAIIHILRDCRNVPKAGDYITGAADVLGLKSTWPVSAYIHYPEEAFTALAKFTIEGSMAVVLSAFFRSKPDIANFLVGMSRLSISQQQEYLEKWEAINARSAELEKSPISQASVREVDGAIRDYLKETEAMIAPLLGQIAGYRFGMVPADQLITPLTLIDLEYVEELKAALTGTEPKDVAAFALPRQVTVSARAALDPSGRSVNFVSSEKMLSLMPLVVAEIPGVGFEIKIPIVGTPQLILVSHVAGRLYLKSGVHRTYLLASLGVKEIPCVIVEENQVPFITGIYPSFAPHVLALPRPPLLMDTFDPALTLLVPIARTSKVIRISTEELILPLG